MELPADAAISGFQLLVSVGAVVIQWRTSSKETRTWPLFALRTVVILGAIALCAQTIAGSAERRRREDALRAKLEDQEQLLSKVGALQGGDREILQKYLALDHQMNLTFAQASVTDFSESLEKVLASLPERQARRSDSLKHAQHLASELRPQIEPVADSLVTQFDAHVDALTARQIKVEYVNRAETLPGAVTRTARFSTTQVRAISIGRIQLLLDVHPARVNETGEIDDARLVLTLHDRPALSLTVSQFRANLKRGEPPRDSPPLTFGEYDAQLDDVVQNAELRKAIGRALGEVFTVAIIRASDLEEEDAAKH